MGDSLVAPAMGTKHCSFLSRDLGLVGWYDNGLSYYCDKISDTVKGRWVYYGSQLEGMGMLLWWGLETAGHKASVVGRRRAEMLVLILFSPFYLVQEPKPWKCATHI